MRPFMTYWNSVRVREYERDETIMKILLPSCLWPHISFHSDRSLNVGEGLGREGTL